MSRRTSSGRSSGRSRRPSASDRGGAPTSAAAVDAEGKAEVACPQCGNRYRIAKEVMDKKVQCRNCKRTFFPRAAASKRKRTANSTSSTPFLIGGIVVAVVVAIILIVNNLGPGQVKMAPKEEVVRSVNIGWDNPRVQATVAWTTALASGNTFELMRHSDMGALEQYVGVAGDQPIRDLVGQALTDANNRLLEELTTGAATQIFRDFKAIEGRLQDEAMHDAATGVAELNFAPREGTDYYKAIMASGKRYFAGAEARIGMAFRADGDEVLVTGWEVLHNPPKPRVRKPRHTPHATIAKPEVVERVIDGEKKTVRESQLSALGHLPDTPDDLRAEIDQLIVSLVDLSQDGRVSNRCLERLADIGRPAIPRLLNKMYEAQAALDAGDKDEKLRVRRVIQVLTYMTGVRVGFNVADRSNATVDGDKSQRISALKQWYAWWYKTHDRDYTTAIDKAEDESLLMTEAEKKAQRDAQKAAEAAAQKKHQ